MTSFLERLTDLEAKATPSPWLRDGVLSDAWRVTLSPEKGSYIAIFATGEGQEHDGEANAEIARFLRNAVPEVKALIEAAQRVSDADNYALGPICAHLGQLAKALDALNCLEVNHG